VSFTDDSRPDTRRLVVAGTIIRALWIVISVVVIGGYLLTIALGSTSTFTRSFSDIAVVPLMTYLPLVAAEFVVRRAKKNADARWALAQSRTAALAAKVTELEEPAAR